MGTRGLVPEGIAYAHEAASKSYDDQMSWIDALDTKAGILMAADGVIISFVATRDSTLMEAPPVIGVATALFLFCSLVFALLGFSMRRYEVAPDLDPLLAQMQHQDDEGLKWIALEGLSNAVAVNESKVDGKAWHVFLAGLSLLAGVLVLAGHFIYLLISS